MQLVQVDVGLSDVGLGPISTRQTSVMSAENSSAFSMQESSVSEASVSEPSAPEMVLPEGYSVMFGEDGQQYVTVVQDDQTYAFPAEEFHQMQQASWRV